MDLSLRTIRKNIAALSVFAIIASMLVVTGVVNAAAADVYQDVNGTEWYAANATWGLDNGVLDSTQAYFRAGDNASRAEFFTMVARGAGIPEATCDESLFPDLNADHWGCPYITAMFEAEIVSGDGAGSATPGYVRPDDNILRAEAAKVVVEAFQLNSVDGKLGSDVFTDVPVGIWYDSYMGIANENCVFQGVNNTTVVEPARQINRAESVTVVQRGANPTTDCAVAVEAGDLTVALDGSSPDSVSIPLNGANIAYSVFALTASADEDVNVEQLVISRVGLGLPGDFKNLKIYVDGVQKGGEKTLNVSTNSATFTFTTDPIVVPAGKTVLVEVRADMNAAQNSQNALCIATSDDVYAMGDASNAEVAVGGAFAVCGNYMTTTSAAVGTLTYTVSQPSTADINIGDTDVVMTKIKMDMATEAADVTKISFKQSGSANPEYFGNPTLYVSGAAIAADYSWSGDYLVFDLSDSPINIAKGSSKTVELWVDVVGGLNTTAAFDIYRDWHIEATGNVYGYGVNVTEAVASISPANRNIVGGNIAVSLSSNNPVPGDVKVGAEDFVFTRFNISTSGDGVTVRKLSLTVENDNLVTPAPLDGLDPTLDEIEDVKIWAKNSAGTWVVVAGPNDFTAGVAGTQTAAFTDSFDVPANSTTEFMISADLTNLAGAADSYRISVANVTNSGLTELEFSDGDPVNEATEVTGGVIAGNWMTVAAPSFTATLAATPGNKTYVRNTNDRDIVAFDIKASTADDLRVTGITINCTGLGLGLCSDAFQSLNLYLRDGSTITKLAGPKSMTKVGAVNGTVTYSLNHTISAGNTARFLLRSNIASAAVGGGYNFGITAAGQLNVEDSDGTAATDNSAYAIGPRTVTVAAAGTFNYSGISDTDVKGRILVGDSTDESVLKVRFSADELESWVIRKFTIVADNNGAAPAVLTPANDKDLTKVYVKYTDKDGNPASGEGTLSGGYVTFNNLAIYVPAGGSQTALVTVDVAPVDSGNAVAGDWFALYLDGIPTLGTSIFEAVGESSATVITAAVDVIGEKMRVAKSAPTVTRVDGQTTLSNGEMPIYKWTVAADGDVAIKQMAFDVAATGVVAADISNFRLYKNNNLISDSANVQVVSQANVDLEGGAPAALPTQVVVRFDAGANEGEDLVLDGTSATYELRATFANIASGDSWTTTFAKDDTGAVGGNKGPITPNPVVTKVLVGGVASNFVWSDLSVGTHSSILGASTADWLDGWLVDGLNVAGSQILSKS